MHEDLIVIADKAVLLVEFNRPAQMNALTEEMMRSLAQTIEDFENNTEQRVLILKGNEKAFSVGVDLSEMLHKTYNEVYKEQFITRFWEKIASCKKPTLAAVSGYALGGGCELALMCDLAIASEDALFGQSEIFVGTIPGIGGTQRLTRLIGKARAMDICLTGRRFNASEAYQMGLVSRVVPYSKLKEEACKIAQTIASFSSPIVQMVKEAICQSEELPLSKGIQFERQLFYSTFALEDQKEGIKAFLEKRKPYFKNK